MNSSDWISHSASDVEQEVPGWISALHGEGEFSEASPFGLDRGQHTAAPAESSPEIESASPPPITEFDRGFTAGEAAGRDAARAQFQLQRDQKTALRLSFRQLDQAAIDALAAELSDTVMTLCGAVLENHAADLSALKDRVASAAKRLGTAASSCTLHLNPQDIADLGDDAMPGWKVEADPMLERGSVVLIGEDGGVRDGPADWRRAIAAALRG